MLQPVSETFIFKQLNDLKVEKATGLHRTSAWFLKDGASVIASTVTFLVNLSLSTGIVPCDWKMAGVVPLWKYGQRKLQRYLPRFDLLSPIQSGFRQHHSTESAVIYFTVEIRRSADSEKLTGAPFIDLKKAFDSVTHKELLSKLKRFGSGENWISWFTSYLSDSFQAVSLNNELSGPLAGCLKWRL